MKHCLLVLSTLQLLVPAQSRNPGQDLFCWNWEPKFVVDSWTQLGEDIDGAVAGDRSGSSIAMSADGNRIAIGAPRHLLNGRANCGHVRVYGWTAGAATSSWQQLGDDLDGTAAEDHFGTSVALSEDGNRLAVWSLRYVRIFDWRESSWIQVGTDIVFDQEWPYDRFGRSVDLSADGSRVAFGVQYNASEPIYARVYNFLTSWVQVGHDIGDVDTNAADFSVALSADGNRIAVGAPSHLSLGSNTGHARVYDWTGTEWNQVGTDLEGESSGDYFGFSVALSSNGARLAVGSHNNDANGVDSGQVRVYEWAVDTAQWEPLGDGIDGEDSSNGSGWSVALSEDGSRVFVGAITNAGNGGIYRGHVRAWDWTGDVWARTGQDIDGDANGDFSGWSVAASLYGSRFAVGAALANGGSGHVRVYEAVWIQGDSA